MFIECNHAGDVEHIATGASAINSVLAHLPGSQNSFYRWHSHLYDVPGIHQIEDLGYRLIARHRGSFDKASCGPDD